MSRQTLVRYLHVLLNESSQTKGATHAGPFNIVSFFTGTTNILFASGGHAITMYKSFQTDHEFGKVFGPKKSFLTTILDKIC